MSVLIIFAVYMIIGVFVNYGSAIGVWTYLRNMCGNDQDLYYEMLNKHTHHGIRFNVDGPTWAKAIITQILWPLNVINTFINGHFAISEARRRIK